MILAIDIGNTNMVVGCMRGREICAVSRLKTDTMRTVNEYAVLLSQSLALDGMDISEFSGAIIASVVPDVTATVRMAVKKLIGSNAFVVGAGIKTGLNIRIDNPAQLGSDLVVGAVAATAQYPCPIIIVYIDTATTLTVIDASTHLLGGAIIPGARLSLNALADSASLLPRVPLEAPRSCIGTNTTDCMKSGAVFGAAAAIDGLIERMEDELGSPATIVVTGALAATIAPHLRHSHLRDDNLHLRGLAIIYEKNIKK